MPDFTGTPTADRFLFPGLNGDEIFDALGGQDTIDGSALFNDYRYNLDNGFVSLTDGSLTSTLRNFEEVLAGNGNDRLIGSGGLSVNALDGGAGDDTLSPGSGGISDGDIFAGGSGTNVFDLTDIGADAVIDMNTGTFTILDATATISGFQRIIAGRGDDFIRELSGFSTELMGGLGDDTLATAASGITGDEVFDGGDGTDMLDFSNIASGLSANLTTGVFASSDGAFSSTLVNLEQIEAGSGNDTLIAGTSEGQRYTLSGNAGDDSLVGSAASDILLGGTGNDVITGADGNDVIRGDAGFDRLEGGDGDDRLNGGAQADNLLGGTGNDTMVGGQGFDRLFGGNGNDLGFGGTDTDALFGQAGNDVLSGQDGDDRLFGGIGNDVLGGDIGNDTLGGGAGFDTLMGDAGNELMTGNFNADTFVFADVDAGFGQDTITDFAATNDFEQIDLGGVASIFNLFDLFNHHMSQQGQNVLIDAGGGNTITLLSVDMDDLDRADFLF